MKNYWKEEKLKKLSEVAVDFGRGRSRHRPRNDKKLYGGEYPFIQTGDIRNSNHYIETFSQTYNDVGLAQSKLWPKGTLCITIAANIAETGILTFDACFPDSIIGCVFDPKKINVYFVEYLLQTFKARLQAEGKGSAQDNINLATFENQLFPFPTIQEQQQIVSILDEAFEHIDRAKLIAQKNLQNSKDLFDSYLQDAFSTNIDKWIETTLGDDSLVKIVDGDRGVNYPKQKDFLEEGYCLFLNTKNVRPDGFKFNETMFITKEKDQAMGKGKLSRNDVIMTTRGTIGNLAVYDDSVEFDNVRINSGMLIFRPNTDKILPHFLFEILRSNIIKSQINRHVSGAAQPQLPIKTLVNFKIPVPKSLIEQKEIVEKLNTLSIETKRLEHIYQQKIIKLDQLKQSILQKAFSGELIKDQCLV